jgi:predicted O-methyltransferase YrrM
MILDWLVTHYGIDWKSNSPIEIPNVGRHTLAKWFKEWDFKQIAEIGVEKGEYSEVLCLANPNAKIFCVDSWIGYTNYKGSVRSRHFFEYETEARARLSKYRTQIVKGFSTDVVKQFQDGSLDAVYIDANHELAHVIADIFEWSKKVRKGGVIAGHDYTLERGKREPNDVVLAVNSYTTAYNISPWFILGAEERAEGQIRDQHRSWMWVKQ